jgi:glucosamine--fructose-6-phosphate aminotransferase (isomerizing)
MCGLFGVVQYGKGVNVVSVKALIEKLSHGAAVRGTHATGIAYNNNKEMVIDKAAESAYKFKGSDKIPHNARTIMGHTRHTTQGSEKKNFNNHPFLGVANKKECFAFAHNGVLDNDFELKRTYKLPDNGIETDSYVAAQMIETQGKVTVETVQWMAERVEGMFTFTILDQKDQLYIVKNDSPMNVIHVKAMKMYVYASTADILHEALLGFTPTRSLMLDILRGKRLATDELEYLEPKAGQILLLKQDGTIDVSEFSAQDRVSKYQNRWAKQQANGGAYGYHGDWEGGHPWWDDRTRGSSSTLTVPSTTTLAKGNEWYEDFLKNYAHTMGVEIRVIADLVALKFTYDEIEEALYTDSMNDLCKKAGIVYQAT